MRTSLRFLLATGFGLTLLGAHAQTAVTPLPASAPVAVAPIAPAGNTAAIGTPAEKPVIASGTVPDEATKAAVLARLRELYGAARVVDRIEVASVVAPANWSEHVLGMLTPDLQQVTGGQLEIAGNNVRVSGNVGNEAQRQQVASRLSTALNDNYRVTNALKIAATQQVVLDQALAGRIIEFQSGSSILTPQGTAILDEMAAALKKIGNKRVEIIGHTDSVGVRTSNVALSMSRATAVKAYLEQSGIASTSLSVQGLGPDQPVADNATPEGRARNRRIEFKVL
ncbi:OmpA family protein [Montanilutibacter psychrotolerans]|uniref:Cell envelope biogenesis protein OmpA n=1 Tax=Montanilutibacter psychrotolerans TaxID=1327343 RepID=A0A3M8SWI3_9GAMM|nr:OmpA family protein [Lysobacter psychrotolerans]RNF83574.1 cell envelope biogenesis protein OmpA [Lysobacter psychrotolerans]